ncbi:MAG: enoyl-CoA hydratase/isomerase family protein [Maricaulaceae bacterium]
MSQDVIIARQGGLGRMTLNRPKALNALTLNMVRAMVPALLDWREDPSVKAVVVDAAPGRAFCAGGDIRALYDAGKAGTDAAYQFWFEEYQLNTLIKEYPKPYVALIDGVTMGGGVGISVHGSHRVAGDDTLLAMPETGIGFYPDVGGTFFLPRLPEQIGAWMGLTGARLKASDCLAAGLATHYVPTDNHPGLVAALATAKLDDDGERLETLLERYAADPGPAPLAEPRAPREHAFSAPNLETILDRLAAAGDPWSQKQLDALTSKSPTALKLTFQAMRSATGLEFRDALTQELALSTWCLTGGDFYEGVRAVIIDKDNAPQWSPPTLADVDDAAIAGAFSPLPADKALKFLGDRP